jgi:hypothetical protein
MCATPQLIEILPSSERPKTSQVRHCKDQNPQAEQAAYTLKALSF